MTVRKAERAANIADIIDRTIGDKNNMCDYRTSVYYKFSR